MGAERALTTPKYAAQYAPQTECEYFSENYRSYECRALTQCYCCLEPTSCRFYRGEKAQMPHTPLDAPVVSQKKRIISKSTMMAMQAEHEAGKPWTYLMQKYQVSNRQLTDARIYYGMEFRSRGETRRALTDEQLAWAVRAHEDGMEWDAVAKKLGFTRGAIRDKLRRDASKGIYHR